MFPVTTILYRYQLALYYIFITVIIQFKEFQPVWDNHEADITRNDRVEDNKHGFALVSFSGTSKDIISLSPLYTLSLKHVRSSARVKRTEKY